MMWDFQGTKHFVEDETMCGPLCQHPSCWSSNNRKVKGIPRIARRIPSPDSIETDLPTVKVYNMLEDYGDDNKDSYPTRHKGKAAHRRKSSLPNKDAMMKSASSGFKLKAPAGTPRSMDPKEITDVAAKKQMKILEVQEVFDVNDLNSTWDNTFVPKQCMVWVPNPKYKRKITEDQMASIHELAKGSRPKLLLKDLTGDVLPADLDYDQMSFTKRRRGRSPPMSSRRITPFTRSGGSRRPPFIFDMAGLDELLELPRDILIQVLDNAKPSDFTSKETMHTLIEKFYPSFDRGISNLTSASQQELLQQKKMNIHEGKTRNLRTGHLIETKPVFHLDEDGVEQPRHIVEAISERSHQPLDSEYVESIRDLYINRRREYNQKKPLPPIGQHVKKKHIKKGKGEKSRISSISLGLPELPSGVKRTRAFTYNKRNYQNFDLTIAPVPTPPTSFRDTESRPSEHGTTTMRVNVPSVESGKDDVIMEDRGSTDTPHSSKSGRDHAPLHTVSPTLSTKVPHAPATTPATHQTPTGTFIRDNTQRSQTMSRGLESQTRNNTSSPTQNIRAPTNSPRLSPEPTGGLDTIKEAQHEDSKDMPHPVSRGGRSVRFSQDVPEVPAPPSTPDPDNDGAKSSVTTPMEPSETHNPTSGNTVRTNKSTYNTTARENSDLELRPQVSRKEPSTVSTPEPWPAVNEADFDLTPSGTNIGLHESSQYTHSTNPNMDSRLAVGDPSSRSLPTANSTIRSDLGSGTSLGSRNASGKGESPGPPPPSPEGKDKRQDEPKSGRKRDLISRESSMTPLMEEKDEEHEDVYVRTLVVEVPPLGQPTERTKPKNHRTTDTFINIDIPATSQEEVQIQNLRSLKGNNHMTEIVERPLTEEYESSEHNDNQTVNTRDAVLSVQTTSEGEPTNDPDSQSNMDSAGVTPSIGANTSPTSTIPENKLKMDDLKFMDQTGNDQDQDQNQDDQNQDTGRQEQEMTENGGDHIGFKQELQEELDKLSQKENAAEQKTNE